jgi:hypothetical protein
MAHTLTAAESEFSFYYAGRKKEEMAFYSDLKHQLGERAQFFDSAENQRLDLIGVLTKAAAESVFYVCGPAKLLAAVSKEAELLKISPDRIRFERFTSSVDTAAEPVLLNLQRSKRQLQVSADQTLLDALIEDGVETLYSCKTGVCKTCAVKVLDGEPIHRDTVLTENEKGNEQLMCLCVSRASTKELTLDI